MKVTGYIQIVNRKRGAVMERVTKTRPRDPIPGAVVVKATLEAEGAIPAKFVGRVPVEPEALDEEDDE